LALVRSALPAASPSCGHRCSRWPPLSLLTDADARLSSRVPWAGSGQRYETEADLTCPTLCHARQPGSRATKLHQSW